MVCPFQYGTTANHHRFIDRTSDIAQLKDLLCNGKNVVLMSPRGWGKTSLIKSVAEEIAKENNDTKICFVDAFGIKTEENFYIRLQETVRKILPDADDAPPQCTREDIFRTIEEKAAAKKLRLIICIKEFQQLTYIQNYDKLEKALYTAQKEQKNTVFCISGNDNVLMTQTFDTYKKGLYKFGQLIKMPRIDKAEWIKYITSHFKKSGKYITEQQAELICNTTECNSYYVQQLCFFVWTSTTMNVEDFTIEQSIQQLVDTNAPTFYNLTETLTSAQVAMLKAVMHGEYQFNAAKIVEQYNLGNAQTITRNKRAMVERGYIEKLDDHYSFCDPVYAVWFRHNMM